MAKPLPVRNDGVFGTLYSEHSDIRSVIAAYRELFDCGYLQAWAAWFHWALSEGGK